jgi:copper resistance protein D
MDALFTLALVRLAAFGAAVGLLLASSAAETWLLLGRAD